MANTAKQTPIPTEFAGSGATRSESEIAFVLKRAKWRQGPEVLRALASGEASPPETAPRAPATAPRQRAKNR